MKSRVLFTAVCIMGAFLVAGCSFDSINPFAKEPETKPQPAVSESSTGKQVEKESPKVDIDKATVNIVNETRAGFFEKAIALGEEAYEQGQSSVKFLDTLAVAYGYKNQLQGLKEEEKEKYLRTVRQLVKLDPASVPKKLHLAGALIETDSISEGNKVALELYNGAEVKTKEIIDVYGWSLYKAGRVQEALPLFLTLKQLQPDNLSQTYHTAVVIETVDQAQALALYKRIVEWANNALTWEENRENMASTALINKIKKDAEDAINRIQLRGRSAQY